MHHGGLGRDPFKQRIAIVGIALGAAIAISGCDGSTDYFDSYSCTDPDIGHKDEQGEPDPCHENDTGQRCAGECVAVSPPGWSEPLLLWVGKKEDAPECPPEAPRESYEGHDQLVAPKLTCNACACQPSTGTCALPTTMTASSSVCPGSAPGSKHYDFSAVPGWDGLCTTTGTVAAGNAQSLTIGPITVVDDACKPVQPDPTPKYLPRDLEFEKPSWELYARVCQGKAYIGCPNAGETCAPVVPSPSSFRQCIYQKGETMCPPSPYEERFVFYGDYNDQRHCSACECGPPTGSACSSTVTVYKDSGCATTYLISATLSSNDPQTKCLDFQKGVSLGSKSATKPVYTPGTCMPLGGQPEGEAEPIEPSTFCCLP